MAIKKIPTLEFKDRTYILKSKATPISYVLSSKNTKYKPLLYFDGQKNRALRYSPNQKSCFEDAQDENVILEPVIFENGKLFVKKENTLLQLFLSVLHPELNITYFEFDPESNAQEDVEDIEVEFEALQTAMSLDITELEAIARVVNKGTETNVDKMTSSEIKRDMLRYAKNSPDDFLKLANDGDIKLRNLAVRAIDLGVLTLRDNNTTVYWGKTKKKLISIPFGDNPYTALASYFKTDEGVEAMQSIIKKLE